MQSADGVGLILPIEELMRNSAEADLKAQIEEDAYEDYGYLENDLSGDLSDADFDDFDEDASEPM